MKRKRSTVPPCLHPSGMPLVSSVTGGPVPAYISVGGSKAVAVPRAATGAACSQRRLLSAVMPGQRPFQCLFSTVHHITCPPLCQAGGPEIPFQSRRGGSEPRGFHQTAAGSKAAGYRMADPPCKSFSACRPPAQTAVVPIAAAPLRAGDDPKTVQSNLGHATAAFTLDVYGHMTDQMKQASSARMEAFIKGLSAM